MVFFQEMTLLLTVIAFDDEQISASPKYGLTMSREHSLFLKSNTIIIIKQILYYDILFFFLISL